MWCGAGNLENGRRLVTASACILLVCPTRTLAPAVCLSLCPSLLLLQVEGLDIVVEGIVGSTGLELKSDPGVPLVYAGFGALMITTLISYISHSQVGQGRAFV